MYLGLYAARERDARQESLNTRLEKCELQGGGPGKMWRGCVLTKREGGEQTDRSYGAYQRREGINRGYVPPKEAVHHAD